MIVVSDTTPLITLMKANQLQLLHTLFGEVRIPVTVYEELTSNQSFQSEIELIRSSSFIKIVSVQNQQAVTLIGRVTGLDKGETEAIVYADEQKADILLMDEAAGRKVARNMGLTITGSIGILMEAYQRDVLSRREYEKAIHDIRVSNRHISERLLNLALQMMDGSHADEPAH